ncbi:MAG: J domain-containing protein [Candidatus Hodgkinia cicadicola]
MRSPYEILGVSKTASDADIRAAFKLLALKHHPDRNLNNPEATKRFKEINEAYSILKDPKTRAQYDERGARPEFTKHPFEDFFGTRAPKRRLNKTRGRNVRLRCALKLEQIWTGARFKFTINTKVECKHCKCEGKIKSNKRVKCSKCNGRGITRKRQGIIMFERTCSNCRGSGTTSVERCKKCAGEGRHAGKRNVQFNIKPGTPVGSMFRLTGLGEAGTRGARAGALCVRVGADTHPFYNSHNADLFCTLIVSYETASLGGKLEFYTVIGTPLTLIIPSATPADKLFVLRQRGLPSLKSGVGDLHVKLMIRPRRHITSNFSKHTLYSLQLTLARLNSIWNT